MEATSKQSQGRISDPYQEKQRITELEASLKVMTEIANNRGTLAQQAQDFLKALPETKEPSNHYV